MRIEILTQPVTEEFLRELAREGFGHMVKIVVDIDREIIGTGGDLHADIEEMLLDGGSRQASLWGANYYLNRSTGERLQYTAMINIRPNAGNPSQTIQDPQVRDQVRVIVIKLFGRD